MRIRWRNFELPSQVRMDRETATNQYGRFVVEPFEKGFGATIGNGLRRVLLSSIEGTAVTWVKIDGVVHEFSTIPGVLEDVTQIILNIKKLRVKMHTDAPTTLRIDVNKRGEVLAEVIDGDHNIEIANPELKICTLTDDVRFLCEMQVKKGRGYVTAEENVNEDAEVGTVPVDSIFSPVHRVKYAIENTRVGKSTDYDRLVLEVWTDGTVNPEMALVEASKIYRKHLNPFVQYFELKDDLAIEGGVLAPEGDEGAKKKEMIELLNKSIDMLELSVRAKNCLDSENVQTMRQMVQMSEPELLKVRNFGKTSLKEVKNKLSALGLSLGMSVEDYK
ncbi:DNA-directed RNA polymerase subunit alpha [Planctomycetota bacterium]|jgi:DNA-directed RNA polymerase subunit alpha|nr:DNA-directed RNA polymerase subunit alpha [Planctomycetota bacterium]MSR39339.1 DNA-directed RNA polymerase subunit alpha [Planctomycetota bacterium]GDY01015.1 DNA-directed RNA polymerase subunit alpha [Planctomycetota bacterium]